MFTNTTFLTQTLGCRVNQAETKKISNQLTSLGYQEAKDNQPPDIVIINTCVITQKGEQESIKVIRRFKKTYPNCLLIATGCAVNLWLKISKKKQPPPADLFITNEKKSTIPKIIAKRFPFSCQIRDLPIRKPLIDPGSVKRVFVKVQDGCNHFCSYCIVPYLRTKPTSKRVEQIVKEINQAYRAGTKEVVLCGINLSLFGQDLDSPTTFADLIEEILEKTKIPRLSLSSLTPKLINQKLINIFIADQEKNRRLSSYWHLALQSGSKTVLERMNRQTNLKQLNQSLHYIKEALPYFTLRADIMIGFPGETDQEFNQTQEFIKKNRLSFGHLFSYSPRPQTKAQKMIKNKIWTAVPNQVKKERRKKLQAIIKKNREREKNFLLGKTREILILKPGSYGWWGLSDNYWPTKIRTKENKKKDLIGQIIPVKIVDSEDKFLWGNFVKTDQTS
ncbi:MAG: Threonylcarbamoyladenosine tRNA methylthiotransferase MtaB [Microgenomates bacterium 39_6]|nr:MAG: Threonylcarbamoyladenosine tRNA methylthiotransferase MtaB [Microgenomates bacterium 39_6]